MGTSDGEFTATNAATNATPTTAAEVSTSTLPDPTAGTSTTADATSTATGSNGGLPGACQAFCERFPACLPDEAYPLDVCVQQCLQSYQGVCEDAASTFLECAAILTCDEFNELVNNGSPTVCIDERVALEDLCGPGCLMSGLGGPDGCSLGRTCGDQTQDYQCIGGTCTCVENDVPGAACPAAGFCGLGDAAQRQAVNDCCGWDWP